MRPLGRVVLAAIALPLVVNGCTSASASGGPWPAAGGTPTTGANAEAPSAVVSPATQTVAPSPTKAGVPLLLYYIVSPDNPGTGTFWVIGADGTGQRKIADGVEASWSHDGKTIHVVSMDDGCMPTITDVPVNGGSAKKINATLQKGDSHFSWSPDDSQIVFYHWSKWAGFCGWTGWAFTCDDQATPCPNPIQQDLETVAAGGGSGGPRQLVARLRGPDQLWWAPDGKTVMLDDTAYGEAGPLQRVDLATGTTTPFSVSKTARTGTAVSPDSTRVAFTTGTGQPETDLEVSRIDGTTNQDFGAFGANIYELTWSPDGSQLGALIVPLDAKGIATAQNLVVFRPPDSTPKTIYSPIDDTFMLLAWSADGTKIATEKRFGGIVVVGSDGSGVRELPNTDQASYVSWQP